MPTKVGFAMPAYQNHMGYAGTENYVMKVGVRLGSECAYQEMGSNKIDH